MLFIACNWSFCRKNANFIKNVSKKIITGQTGQAKNWHGSDGSQKKSSGSVGSRVLRVGSGRVRDGPKRPRVGSGRVKNPYLVTGHGSRVDPGRRLTRSIPTGRYFPKSFLGMFNFHSCLFPNNLHLQQDIRQFTDFLIVENRWKQLVDFQIAYQWMLHSEESIQWLESDHSKQQSLIELLQFSTWVEAIYVCTEFKEIFCIFSFPFLYSWVQWIDCSYLQCWEPSWKWKRKINQKSFDI